MFVMIPAGLASDGSSSGAAEEDAARHLWPCTSGEGTKPECEAGLSGKWSGAPGHAQAQALLT